MKRKKAGTGQWKSEKESMAKLFRQGKTMREIAVLFAAEPWIIENVIRDFMRQDSKE